jgi:magnesium transporter
MALLTILSAVFMPLTLLSGIWGMNFEEMPELQAEGAYQKALLGMFLLAICMVYSFKRAGFATSP